MNLPLRGALRQFVASARPGGRTKRQSPQNSQTGPVNVWNCRYVKD
jgi:hypothetical protein